MGGGGGGGSKKVIESLKYWPKSMKIREHYPRKFLSLRYIIKK